MPLDHAMQEPSRRFLALAGLERQLGAETGVEHYRRWLALRKLPGVCRP